MKILALMLLLASANGAFGQAPICIPPEEPWVPVNDADLREYVDLIASDFEHYFQELTHYFQCLEQAWQDGIERGRTTGERQAAFAARAKALGLGDSLGVDPGVGSKVPE